MKRGLSLVTLLFVASAALAQRSQQVDPIDRGDLVYLGPDASFACSSVTAFTGSDPCHVGLYIGSDNVIETTSGIEPNAVHTLSLSSFQTAGYRSSMTSYPYSPSNAGRDTLMAYAAAKDARATYYDANHFNQKGGYSGGCGFGVSACWDGWDYFNEFDCVGFTERAYELANAPDSEGPTPDTNPGNGCTWEGNFFMYPQDQYDSCKTTYSQAFPAVGAVISTTVKHGFWRFYTIHIPSGVTSISATTTSSTDVDLYIGELGYLPATFSSTCSSTSSSGNELCTLNNPSAGGWSFGVYGYASGTSSFALQINQAGPPNVLTNLATNVTATSVTLNGTVSPSGLSTATEFDYGTTALYDQNVAAQTVSGASPQSISANVSALACNTLYHFRANGTNSVGTSYGADTTFRTSACPVVFTDDPLVVQSTKIKAIHVTELRNAINAYRSGIGMGAFTFAETLTTTMTIKASHIQELRTALREARSALGLPAMTYTNPVITSAVVKAVDLNELRNALR